MSPFSKEKRKKIGQKSRKKYDCFVLITHRQHDNHDRNPPKHGTKRQERTRSRTHHSGAGKRKDPTISRRSQREVERTLQKIQEKTQGRLLHWLYPLTSVLCKSTTHNLGSEQEGSTISSSTSTSHSSSQDSSKSQKWTTRIICTGHKESSHTPTHRRSGVSYGPKSHHLSPFIFFFFTL